jgi:two-component system LytT family sensor kinase
MMNKLFDIKRFRFYLWVGLAHFGVGVLFSLHDMKTSFGRHVLNEFWWASYVLVLNYWFFEYVLPRLSINRPLRSILLIILQIFLCSWIAYTWRQLGISIGIFTPLATYKNTGQAVAAQMGDSIGSMLFYGIVRHIYLHIKLRHTAQRLQIEKQEAELSYLKSQTNPHFLFNTLNNIYSLSRDKSDLAPESILKLSKILRFMLYEAGGKFIAIEQEIKILNDYIALEKLRYDESLHINFNYDIEDMKQAIPPLLLIPMVENAFKHGVSETRNRPFVDIHLSVNKRVLTFIIKNSTDAAAGDQQVKENIGLSNLRRQLELLYKEYSLQVQHGESTFTATLKINLATHVQNQVYNS